VSQQIPHINESDIQWHFIGHLQKNKIKKAVELVDVIHSVDKAETAIEINKESQKINKIIDVFLQVNSTNEKQKSGVAPHDLMKLLESVHQLPYIKIIGLMTMSRFSGNEDEIRQSFALLRHLKDDVSRTYPDVKYLSMGMSGDYQLAIQEGATHIRVGTAIFGTRT